MTAAFDWIIGPARQGGKKIKGWYDEPYDEAKAANEQAARDSERVGNTAFELGMYGVDRALDQTVPSTRFWQQTYEGDGELAGEGDLERFAKAPDRNQTVWDQLYGDGGSLSGPGALEKLYEERYNNPGYVDAFTQRQLDRGQRNIDNTLAARGISRSGAAIKATADMNADATANLSLRQEGLARDAQAAREGRLRNSLMDQRGVTGDRARLTQASQSAKESRVGGAFDRLNNITTQRSNLVQNGVQGAIDNYTAGQTGGINGRLAGANVGIQKRKDLYNTGGTLGGAFFGSGA